MHMDLAMDTLEFVINISIAETIIDDLFFQDNKQLDKCSSDDSNDNVDMADVIAHKAAKKGQSE